MRVLSLEGDEGLRGGGDHLTPRRERRVWARKADGISADAELAIQSLPDDYVDHGLAGVCRQHRDGGVHRGRGHEALERGREARDGRDGEPVPVHGDHGALHPVLIQHRGR